MLLLNILVHSPAEVSDSNRKFLLTYSWPGNIRELRNALERAVLLSEESVLKLDDLFHVVQSKLENLKPVISDNVKIEVKFNETDLSTLQKLYAEEVTRKLKGNKSKAAKVLGISRPKLDRLLSN